MALDPKQLEDLPKLPGVYLMKSARGRVLYVGKAKDLRSRVRAYFRDGGDGRPAIRFMVQRVADLEFVVTQSEKEAFILENTFIKKYRPRYNVAFRDDKNYLYIRIHPGETYPRLGLVRRPRRDGALYFGPYASSRSVRQTVRLLQQYMGLRRCKDGQLRRSRRTCLNHQMGRCAGVCRGDVSPEVYADRVQEAILFLRGRSSQLLGRLDQRMRDAADHLRFEEAARLRDQIQAIRKTLEGQRVVVPLGPDRDVIGVHRRGDAGLVLLMQIREGTVWENLALPIRPTPLDDREVLISFLKQFYGDRGLVPGEILLPLSLAEERASLEQWLSELAGHRVRLLCPQRGKGRELVEMALQNAVWACKRTAEGDKTLERMASALHTRCTPRVIEGFDISTLGGEEAVGSAVRFTDGAPDRQAYRSYRIRSVQGQDDYAMMYELLQRHLRRRLEEEDLPDLLVVDGGKGQLGVARTALGDYDLHQLDAVALAKGHGPQHTAQADFDHVFLSGRKEPISLQQDPGVMRVLQHLRDEAHRFAVAHHRKRRTRKRLSSRLDDIPGIGEVRKRALLKAFGSLKKVEEADPEQLARVPGISTELAAVIYDSLHDGRLRTAAGK
jgi:excinuclease ABC subunit C